MKSILKKKCEILNIAVKNFLLTLFKILVTITLIILLGEEKPMEPIKSRAFNSVNKLSVKALFDENRKAAELGNYAGRDTVTLSSKGLEASPQKPDLEFFKTAILKANSSSEVESGKKLNIYIKDREVNQIEVGGPYVGMEFHHSSIQPNRISFFYPVANTIDLSEGYWQRGNYPVMTFQLKVGGKPVELTGEKLFNCNLSPKKK